MDDPDASVSHGVQRFRSPIAIVSSAALHAGIAWALLPMMLAEEAKITQRAIEVTLDPPALPTEAVAPARPPEAANKAALKVPSGAADSEQTAPNADLPRTTAVPPPRPVDPDVATIVPSVEPPPAIATEVLGAGAPASAPQAGLEEVLPPVDSPPAVSGRDFARKAPPALPKSLNIDERTQASPPRQPIRQAQAKRESQQQASDQAHSKATHDASVAAKATTDYSSRQAQQDYLWLILRKLSQARFYPQPGEANEKGLVVARLTVARDGRLVDVSLAKSSGFAVLDRSVVDIIRRASPFAPFPADVAVDSYTFVVPIDYRQER
jgi:TonB family protein